MKIRLSRGSIRFRISPSELKTLATVGSLQETVQMGIKISNRFVFEVHLVDVLEQMSFQSEGNTARVLMPQTWLPKWKTQVGFEMNHPLSEGFLKIVVERDLE
jgi:hypothetical protein